MIYSTLKILTCHGDEKNQFIDDHAIFTITPNILVQIMAIQLHNFLNVIHCFSIRAVHIYHTIKQEAYGPHQSPEKPVQILKAMIMS